MMDPARWYLKRLDAQPGKPVALVVEELDAGRRGVMSVIFSRRHGLDVLPLLRASLARRIAAGDTVPVPSRTFDPVDVEP